MKAQKFFFRTLVGLVAGTVIGAIDTGSLGDFLSGLGMVVLCTAGLALLAIVPAAYLLGLLLTFWIVPVGDTSWSGKSLEKPADPALVKYIRASAAEGASVESLTQELLDAGWKADRIRRAMATAFPRRQ